MISFMVIGLPRSATTWAANWLTTDLTHCVHDPLYKTRYDEWDSELAKRLPDRMRGVSCTGVWRWPSWVNAHPARKLILHRPQAQIEAELRQLGLPPLPEEAEVHLDGLVGLHMPFEALFNPEEAEEAWHYLLPGVRFNHLRHQELVNMEMQPRFAKLQLDPTVTRSLMVELMSLAGGD